MPVQCMVRGKALDGADAFGAALDTHKHMGTTLDGYHGLLCTLHGPFALWVAR
jgi:hypothetical protein